MNKSQYLFDLATNATDERVEETLKMLSLDVSQYSTIEREGVNMLIKEPDSGAMSHLQYETMEKLLKVPNNEL
jgi:hypothetical protein